MAILEKEIIYNTIYIKFVAKKKTPSKSEDENLEMKGGIKIKGQIKLKKNWRFYTAIHFCQRGISHVPIKGILLSVHANIEHKFKHKIYYEIWQLRKYQTKKELMSFFSYWN